MARMVAFDRILAEQDSRVLGRRWPCAPSSCFQSGREDSVPLYVLPLGSTANPAALDRSFSSSSLHTVCRYPLYSVLPGFGACVAASWPGHACPAKCADSGLRSDSKGFSAYRDRTYLNQSQWSHGGIAFAGS